jgi:hypothetical protein
MCIYDEIKFLLLLLKNIHPNKLEHAPIQQLTKYDRTKKRGGGIDEGNCRSKHLPIYLIISTKNCKS